jgi:hypothetical protein
MSSDNFLIPDLKRKKLRERVAGAGDEPRHGMRDRVLVGSRRGGPQAKRNKQCDQYSDREGDVPDVD